jgi:hypothetical protein
VANCVALWVTQFADQVLDAPQRGELEFGQQKRKESGLGINLATGGQQANVW